MKCLSASVVALLLLAGGPACAQPRGPLIEHEPETPEMVEARRAQLKAELLAFLPRLVGRFSIEGLQYTLGGMVPPIRVTGMQDCIAVGAGPGVQCVSSIAPPSKIAASERVATVSLRGIDLNALKVRYLEVNGRGFGAANAGTLNNDTLTTRTRVPNQPAGVDTVTRIRAPPDGEIQIQIDLEARYVPVSRVDLYLRRVPQVPAGRSKPPQRP